MQTRIGWARRTSERSAVSAREAAGAPSGVTVCPLTDTRRMPANLYPSSSLMLRLSINAHGETARTLSDDNRPE